MIKLNLDRAVREIEKRKPKLVVVQIPEGLKVRAEEIIEKIESTGTECIVLMDPCFGACDLAGDKAEKLGADLLVHFGHSKMHRSNNALFFPLFYSIDENKMVTQIGNLEGELKKRNLKNICLASTIQFTDHMNFVRESLGKKFKIHVGKGSSRISKEGQVLGCNYSSFQNVREKCDAVVFIGDGLFHPLGFTFLTDKPVFIFNPLGGEIRELGEERELFLRKRHGAIASAQNAHSFAILISTKSGQMFKERAGELRKLIKSKGKKAIILAMDYIMPEYLLGVEVDAYVNTACPRIVIEDYSSFKKPILNPTELEIVLGKKKWEEFKLDELD
ncbi:MAG: diphthamide biosynthesis enzyme Dph2 [Candidatus Diapherotrites archaeon]